MNKVYVGIDVGANGGIFAMNHLGEILLKTAIPHHKGTTEVDYRKMYSMLKQLRAKGGFKCEVQVGVEDVHSLYGMSAKSNFNFGLIKGIKIGMLEALNYDYNLVPPKAWQKLVWIEEDVVLKENGRSKDTKATSLNASKRIFPLVDFRKSSRAKKPHDGIFDAALIAEYIRIIDNE